MSKGTRVRQRDARQKIAAQCEARTWAQVAAALSDPSSPIARGADGAANMITAAICAVTGNQPSRACMAPAITRLAGQAG
jgi:hypothetical protein